MSIQFIKGFLEVPVEVVAVTNAIFVGDPGIGAPRVPLVDILRATEHNAEALHNHRQRELRNHLNLTGGLGLFDERGNQRSKLGLVVCERFFGEHRRNQCTDARMQRRVNLKWQLLVVTNILVAL